MIFATAKSNLHAIRRIPLNPMFSQRSIVKYETVIWEKVELLCKGIATVKESGNILVLSNAFNALAGDVMAEYCFGFGYNHLESTEFSENFHSAFKAVSAFGHVALQFPFIHSVIFRKESS